MGKKKAEKKEPVELISKERKKERELEERITRLEWRVDSIIEKHDSCKSLKGI